MIFDIFLRLQRATARVPAMLYLFGYVLMIPAFAWVYNSMATEFFHSTSQHEAYVLGDGAKVRADLETTVKNQFIAANNGPTLQVDEWSIDIDLFTVNRASFQNGQLHFSAYMRFFSDGGVMTAGPKVFTFDVRPTMMVGFPGAPDRTSIKFPESEAKFSWPVEDHYIFQTPDGVVSRSGALVLTMELQDRITNLENSFNGFPARSSGSYSRMLYFSAVTQTTLGFGDIVPISDRTRLATTFQSILGIIIVGLFLNSLAQGISTGRNQ